MLQVAARETEVSGPSEGWMIAGNVPLDLVHLTGYMIAAKT